MSARCSIYYTGVADDTTRHANVPHTHTHTHTSIKHAARTHDALTYLPYTYC